MLYEDFQLVLDLKQRITRREGQHIGDESEIGVHSFDSLVFLVLSWQFIFNDFVLLDFLLDRDIMLFYIYVFFL